MAHDRMYDAVALSALIFFENNPRLWEYGNNKDKWPELEAALDSVKDFHVINALTQWHQTRIAKLVDSSVNWNECGIVHNLAAQGNDSKANLLVQGLLQMGANPDLVTAAGYTEWTPSHTCGASGGSVDIARVLVLCRPNLALKDTYGDTPAALAREKNKLGVASVFEEAERNGFPTIAQLAQEEKWWAVQNLCRRGIVPEQEKLALHRGKSAVGWARHHKQVGMAEELEYLLNGVIQPKHKGFEEMLVALTAELRKSDAEKEATKQKVEEQVEYLEQLKVNQAMLKKEGDELKEMVLLNLTKTSEDNEDLKKKLAALTGMHSKLKDDLQGKLDHQAEKLNQMKTDYEEIAQQKVAESGQVTRHTVQQPVQRVANSTSKSAGGDEEDMMPVLEAENKALKAEKQALEEEVARLQEFSKAQSLLLSSFMKTCRCVTDEDK